MYPVCAIKAFPTASERAGEGEKIRPKGFQFYPDGMNCFLGVGVSIYITDLPRLCKTYALKQWVRLIPHKLLDFATLLSLDALFFPHMFKHMYFYSRFRNKVINLIYYLLCIRSLWVSLLHTTDHWIVFTIHKLEIQIKYSQLCY